MAQNEAQNMAQNMAQNKAQNMVQNMAQNKAQNMAAQSIARLEGKLEIVTKEKEQAAKYGLQLLGELTGLKDQLGALQVSIYQSKH